MNNLDLNLNNYNLDDLLNLFKLDYNFSESCLKKAKKVTLMTHPDKSGLDMKYFIFFIDAYEMLEKIYYFRNKRKTNIRVSYEINNSDKHILDSLKNKSVPDFNKWFNKLFDKVKIHDEELDSGYGEWYKGELKNNNENVNLSDFSKVFERKRMEAKNAIIKHDDELGNLNSGSSGYNLNRNVQQNYSSGIFSKFQYEDLKKAHSETVIPVTMSDMPVIDNITEYQKKEIIEPMTSLELQKYNERNKYKNAKKDMERAYSLIKNDIDIEESNKKWWGYLKQIKK
tara:strand:+ start:44 stop:895 length:852 start_codon:yes stop_codon:yes gene_type:complete